MLVTVDLCGLAAAKSDERLAGTMAVWLIVFRRIYVEDSDPDALAFHDHVECVAINDVGYAALERGGMDVKSEEQGGYPEQAHGRLLSKH